MRSDCSCAKWWMRRACPSWCDSPTPPRSQRWWKLGRQPASASENLKVFSMRSKAVPKKKQESPPRSSSFGRQFAKDWTRLSHSGRHDMGRPKEAMLLLLANDGPLAAEWLDHELQGEWSDHRECHVKGDLLL